MTERQLFLNGRFYTGKYPYQVAEAILIEGNLVKAIGSSKDLSSLADGSTSVVDLAGRTVWPGLTDSHLHLALLSEKLDAIDCEGKTKAGCLGLVAERVKAGQNGWIVGFGFNQNTWEPAEWPTAAELDEVSPDQPVVLYAKSLHASWVNSAAMHAVGITGVTPNPDGGIILRDVAGEPTGILLETAMELVDSQIPALTPSDLAEKMLNAQDKLFQMGVVGVHDFDRWESLEAMQLLANDPRFKLRVVKNLPAESIEQIEARDLREEIRQLGLIPGWLKCFADGALGPQSAAMLEPYEGSQDSGLLLMTADDVFEIGIRAARAGWPLAVHAIGDAANHAVLDGLTRLRQYESEHNLPALPHRVEHVQCLHPDDVDRFKKLGLVASTQPLHATSDCDVADKYWGQRCQTAYAYGSLARSGAFQVFGSDAPVESPNPFWGMHAGVTRSRQSRPASQPWYPHQRLELLDCLAGYSQRPAQLSGSPAGWLEVGRPADLIVLDQDPSRMDPNDLFQVKLLLTMVNGEIVSGSLE